jgi:hypothetical protein
VRETAEVGVRELLGDVRGGPPPLGLVPLRRVDDSVELLPDRRSLDNRFGVSTK